MIEKAKRLLSRLKDNLLPVAVVVLLVAFYLYIPFIHGRLNAQAHGPTALTKTASLAPGLIERPAPLEPAAEAAGPAVRAKAPSPPEKPEKGRAAHEKAVFFDPEDGASGIDIEPGAAEDDAPGLAPDPYEPPPFARPAQKRRAWPPDITRGDKGRMDVSITFDGGYKANEAMAILNTLRARGIRTTIFLTGLFIKRHPGITRLIVLDGHEVGNHTMTHPHLTEYAKTRRHKTLPWVDEELLVKELKEAEEAFREATGKEMAPLWRAPYGEVNPELRAWAFAQGYLHIGWTYDPGTRQSLDTLDWVYDRSSRHYLTSGEIKERILGFGRDGTGVNGGIILMHLGTERRTDTASAVLGEMIDELAEMGYRFVRVSELIDGDRALKAAAKKKAGAYDLGRAGGDGRGPS